MTSSQIYSVFSCTGIKSEMRKQVCLPHILFYCIYITMDYCESRLVLFVLHYRYRILQSSHRSSHTPLHRSFQTASYTVTHSFLLLFSNSTNTFTVARLVCFMPDLRSCLACLSDSYSERLAGDDYFISSSSNFCLAALQLSRI